MMRTRGMSLLEIMVALAVVSVVLSLAVVGMQRPINGQRESEAARELWSSALRARQRAVSTNQPVRIVVEADVLRPDGQLRTVARWERLKCDSTWDNNTCPQNACVNTTCRANAACCDEVGPDIVIPTTMDASAVHRLCFMPGSGRAVRPADLGCMRGQLGNQAALNAATPGNLRLNFTSGKPRTLLMMDPLTGLVSLRDCDAVGPGPRPAECN